MTVDRIWYILGKKLTGEASEEELNDLEDLLCHHPELHYPIQHIIELWRLDKKTDHREAIQALQRHLLRIADQHGEIVYEDEQDQENPALADENGLSDQHTRTIPRRKAAKITIYIAAASLITIVFLFFRQSTSSPEAAISARIPGKNDTPNEISTRPGSHSHITLPDGSQVVLNGNSMLTYDKYFDKEIREVQLNGEAYFDVTKNPDRPFIIHTRQMDIKVLGTSFNVKSYDNDKRSETSLIRGSIEVTMKNDPAKKIILKPADKLVIVNNAAAISGPRHALTTDGPDISMKKINYLPADSTVIETSWVDDRLIFRDLSFSDMAVEMERKYGVAFRFTNEKVKQLRFNGNFKNETIDQILKALQMANHFSYQKINGTIIITN
jgi:ferric-dicitrate binding protein FerR (iron transport regulator)